jgi:hypothetical protein
MATSVTYSECVSILALNIQHAKRTRHISSHVWPFRFYHIFPHYLINGTIFAEKLLHIKCVFIFSITLSTTFLIVRRTQRGIVINIHSFSCKVPCYSCQILIRLEFPRQSLRKLLKCQISWKSVQWKPSCPMRRDRQTDMTKLVAASCNFAKVPTNWLTVQIS